MFSIPNPTGKNLEYLRRCVRSIRENSANTYQINVHINDSGNGGNGGGEWVMRKQLDATFSEANVSICRAVNERASRLPERLGLRPKCPNDRPQCLPVSLLRKRHQASERSSPS